MIGYLPWAEHSNSTGLELVGGVKEDAAYDDVIFKTILQDFERLIRPEAVVNQNSWFLMRLNSRLGVKHIYEPL
jgi:hypothetical protein